LPISHRRIDHLVLAVRDLDAAADFYKRLGFQVGQRNRPPWGTENRLIQFETSFLELITVGDDPDAIPLTHRSISVSVLSFGTISTSEKVARGTCSTARTREPTRLRPRQWDRPVPAVLLRAQGRRPDGSEMRVAITLALAVDRGLPDVSFFVCQQHNPGNFWNTAFQNQPNGTTGIESVTLQAAGPSDHADFPFRLFGVADEQRDRGGLAFPLQRGGRLLVKPGDAAAGFSAFTIAVPDPGVAEEHLKQAGMLFRNMDGHIAVDAVDVYGVTIGLVGDHITGIRQ
jgi:hypothetical protein